MKIKVCEIFVYRQIKKNTFYLLSNNLRKLLEFRIILRFCRENEECELSHIKVLHTSITLQTKDLLNNCNTIYFYSSVIKNVCEHF